MPNTIRALGVVAAMLAMPLFSVSPAPAAQTKDPLVGKWVLDFGKSNFRGVAAPTSKTLVVTPIDNGLSVKETILNANGATDVMDFTAKFDGKAYDAPAEAPLSKIMFHRVDPDTLEQTGINRNMPVETVTFKVGNSGKTLTVTTNSKENPNTNTVQVFDRM